MSVSGLSDEELLASQELGSFALFYRAHVEGLLGFLRRRTGDAELAADLTAKPLGTPSIRWNDAGCRGTLVMDRTVSGRMTAGADVRVDLSNSLVDAVQEGGVALASSEDGRDPAGHLRVADSTVLGSIHVRAVESAE